MRALLVCAAPAEGSVALVGRLAARSELVIAVDGGGALCRAASVVPDVVLGDFDSLSADDLDWLVSQGAQRIGFPAEKDESDLSLALDEAKRRGATAVTITAATGGRLDHTLAALGVLSAAAALEPHVVEPDLEVWVLCTAGRSSVSLAGAGATFSAIAFGGPAVVSAKGVVWELDSARLAPESSLGLSNRIGSQGSARISVHDGVVLVIAPRVSGEDGAREE